MNTDCLPFSGSGGEQLPIVDADVLFYARVELGQCYEKLLAELIENTAWRQDEITIYGKTYLQPRLTAWFGNSELSYCYSGISMEPRPWSDTPV